MLSVKNFDKFQHYKDRSPVWIKLYRSLLRDYEFASLPDAARGQLLLIWLLASETGNELPNDAAWIGRQINASDPVDIDLLIRTGFLVDTEKDASKSDSAVDETTLANLLAQSREREERETEKEREADASQAPQPSRVKPRSVTRKPTLCDDEYLLELQSRPAYAALNVQQCYYRASEWCRVNGRMLTQRFFVNWLNRERPMTAAVPKQNGNTYVGKSPPAPPPIQVTDADMADIVEDFIAADDLIGLGEMYDAIINRGGAKAEWEIACVAYYELHKDEPAGPERMAQLNASINALANR